MDPGPLIDRLEEVLARHGPGIVAVYLFGSVSTGRAKAESDVDVAILFAEPPPARLDAPPLTIEGELERAVRRPVDVVNLNAAPVDLAIRVLRQGRLIHETDRARRIRFEVDLRNAWFDFEPVLRRYRGMELTRP